MFNKSVLVILFILIASSVFALRVGRPPIISYPITADQVANLNKFLEDIYNIQNGRQEIDVVTTPKTNAKNGEVWIVISGATTHIQWKANNLIYTSN